MVQVGGTHGVRIEVDAAEVDDPGQLRGVAHDDLLRGTAGRKRELHGLDPSGTRCRGAFLKEGLPLCPIDEPLEGHGAAANAAQRSFRDGHVIADQVELRVARLREEDLVRVADRDLTPGDLEDLVLLR